MRLSLVRLDRSRHKDVASSSPFLDRVVQRYALQRSNRAGYSGLRHPETLAEADVIYFVPW